MRIRMLVRWWRKVMVHYRFIMQLMKWRWRRRKIVTFHRMVDCDIIHPMHLGRICGTVEGNRLR